MERTGKRLGGTPTNWVCLFHNVNSTQFKFVQEFDGAKWVDCVLEDI